MKSCGRSWVFAVMLASISLGPVRGSSENRDLLSAGKTCEPSIPIAIALVPQNVPSVGAMSRFQVNVESRLDPDLVRAMRVEYEIPERLRRTAENPERREIRPARGLTRLSLGVVIPDEARYQLRARCVVELRGGGTISQTAEHWIDLGAEDPPEGMIGRIAMPDGTGIRVYRGLTVRN